MGTALAFEPYTLGARLEHCAYCDCCMYSCAELWIVACIIQYSWQRDIKALLKAFLLLGNRSLKAKIIVHNKGYHDVLVMAHSCLWAVLLT